MVPPAADPIRRLERIREAERRARVRLFLLMGVTGAALIAGSYSAGRGRSDPSDDEYVPAVTDKDGKQVHRPLKVRDGENEWWGRK